MSIVDTIFENKQVADYMAQQLHNNWSGTRFEDYPRLDPKQKGVFGELYVEALMRTLGRDVTPPTNPGHDRTIDGIKTEIKFSLAGSNRRKDGKLIDPDSFTLYKFKGEKPPLLVFVGSFVTMKPIPLVAVETSSADTEIVVKSNDDANKDVKSFLDRFLIY